MIRFIRPTLNDKTRNTRREYPCNCICEKCSHPPYAHGCGSKKCNGPRRWDAQTRAKRGS